MDINATPVLEAYRKEADRYSSLWDSDELGKQSASRLKYAGVRKRFPQAPSDAIAMWIADMNIRPPDEVIAFLQQHIVTEYGYQYCDIGQAVADWHSQQKVQLSSQHTSAVLPEHVVDAVSTIGAIDTVLRTFCSKGDKVMHLLPGYPPLQDIIESNELQPISIKLPMSGNEAGNTSHIETIDIALLDTDAKAFLLCHPNNPTGTVLGSENQAEIIRFCERHNILLIVDAVHSDFGFLPHVAPSSVPLFGAARGLLCSPILIHINSASKTFNLASVPGASYAIVADDAKREALRRALYRRHLYASHLSKLALICAYKASRKWLEQVLAAIEFNRNFVNAFFYHHKLKATYTMGAAGYFLWLSISSITPQLKGNDTSSTGFTRTVSTFNDCVKNGVIGSDGSAFGNPGFIRLNLACSPETIERALNRICFC